MIGSDELWQAYDERGEAIAGRSVTKLEARHGALHGASHIWIWRGQGKSLQLLLQKRASDEKHTWPGYLDVSAAGHIDFGETPLFTAVREVQEELGLDIAPTDLRLLFVYRQDFQDPAIGIIENEFQMVYGLRLERDIEVNSDDEVESVQWMPLAEVRRLVAGKHAQKIVPQGKPYFANLFKEVQR